MHTSLTTPSLRTMRRHPLSGVIAIILAFLLLPGWIPDLRANTAFLVGCKKPSCSSCKQECGGTCMPAVGIFYATTEWNFYKIEGKDSEAKTLADDFIKNKKENGIYCQIIIQVPVASKTPGSTQPAGVSSLAYNPSKCTFDGVSPDFVKCTNYPGTGERMPRQFDAHTQTVDFRLSPDGRGYEVCSYPKKDLPDPGADGIRVIPPGAMPLSSTTYRNPNPDPAVCGGDLDIVHKQQHPETGEWVTKCVRVHAPVDSNDWKQDYYDGDPGVIVPGQAVPLAPYKTVAIALQVNTDGTETTTEVTSERGADGQMAVSSDATRTHAFHKNNFPVVTREIVRDGRGGSVTTDWTYYTDPADTLSYNKPATMRRSDGSWANYNYQGSEVTGITITKTTTGLGDAPAPAVGAEPNPATYRVVTEIEAKNETGTFGREEKVAGVIVSKTWGERSKAPDGSVVETRHRETGGARLTTVREYNADDTSAPAAARARLKSVAHPDGTREECTYALEGQNLVVTTDRGVGMPRKITSGTRERCTYFPGDIQESKAVTDIATGMPLHNEQVVSTTPGGCPKKTAYDNDPSDYKEITYGCCGIEGERARNGTRTQYINDALKRPVAVTTTTGARVITRTYQYGASGGLPSTTVTTTATGVAGSIVQTSVSDLRGRVISQTTPGPDGSPETTTYTYSADGRVTTQTNPDGGTVITETYADGRTKTITGTATIARAYTYATHAENGGGEVTTATTAGGAGGTESTFTDLAGRTFKTTRSAPHGQTAVSITTYNTLGQAETASSSGQPTVKYLYNPEGERVATWTDRNGDGTFNDTDANGVKDACSTSTSDYIPSARAPEGLGDCQRSITTDRTEANEDKIVTTTWQSIDGLRSRQETLGVANPATATRTRSIDGASTSTQVNPDGTSAVSTTSILANGNQQTQVQKLDSANVTLETSSSLSDALGRTTKSTNGRGHVTTYTYYPDGGQAQSITQVNAAPGGGDLVTATSYTLTPATGRLSTTTLPDGSHQYRETNLLGQTTRQWGSQTNPVSFTYDTVGRMATLTTFRAPVGATADTFPTIAGDTTTWTFDPSGALLKKTYADDKGTTYSYDIAGRLVNRVWARGISTTYGHIAGQLTSVDYSDDTPDVTNTYDRLGRMLSQSNGVATTAYAYDANLRLDKETITIDADGPGPQPALTRILDRSTDTMGRDTGYQVLEPDNLTLETSSAYAYETSGRMSSVTSPAGAFTYGYLPNSNLIQTVTGPVHTVTNTWEPNRDVLASKENRILSTSTVVSRYDYTVNLLNQRTGVQTTGTAFATQSANWAWGYDTMDQVVSADSPTDTNDRAYEYDAIGNRKKSADSLALPTTDNYAVNALNQYTAVDAFTPSFDDDGNQVDAQIRPIGSSSLESCVYSWDGENRLVSVKDKVTDAVIASYTYDAQSRRVTRTQGTSTTLYLYDGWNCMAEYAIQNSTFIIQNSYTWGIDFSGTLQGAGGVGGLLKTTKHQGQGTKNDFFPTYDGNGNVSEYLSMSDTTTARFGYDPFGRTVASLIEPTNLTHEYFPCRFSTKPVDSATGLYYFGFRWYESGIGRWLSRDPMNDDAFHAAAAEVSREYIISALLLTGVEIAEGQIVFDDPVYVGIGNNAVNRVDRFGLATNTLEAAIEACLRLPSSAARIKCLEGLTGLEGCDDCAINALVAAEKRLMSKAVDLISGSLKRSSSYHSELEQKTYQELIELAKGKGDLAKRAQQMKKLIEQGKRLLEKCK